MFPIHSTHDVPDGSLADAKQRTKVCLGDTAFCVSTSDLSNVRVRKFGGVMGCASITAQFIAGMSAILTACDVLKIFNFVIVFVAVFMVHFATIGDRTYEGHHDKSVDVMSPGLTLATKHHTEVSPTVVTGTKNAAYTRTSRRGTRAFDASFIRDRVNFFVTFDRLPMFAHVKLLQFDHEYNGKLAQVNASFRRL